MLRARDNKIEYDSRFDMDRRSSFDSVTDIEASYEVEKKNTSEECRMRLLSSLRGETFASQNIEEDDRRYSAYRARYQDNSDVNFSTYDNNYDRMLAKKSENKPKKVFSRKKLPLIATYIVFAIACVMTITFTLMSGKDVKDAALTIGRGSVEIATSGHQLAKASAEPENVNKDVSASNSEDASVECGGLNYIKLADGTYVKIEIPNFEKDSKNDKTSFDKFCNKLNNIVKK